MDAHTPRTGPTPPRTAFEDAFGRRHHAVLPSGEAIEVLEFRDEFCTPAFEAAVRERIRALAAYQNTCFSRVRSVQRLKHNASKLVVVSDHVAGARLSAVLAVTKQQLVPLEVSATLCLIRQLVAAVAMLHEKLPPMAHGAISPERIVLTDNARLVVVDHVLGLALTGLRYSHEKYWNELRIPLVPAAPPAFDQRADVMQIGMIALALMLDRPIEREEYPDQIEELVERAWTLTATRAAQPLPTELRTWLSRMLQLDAAEAFASAVDAWTDFERVVGTSENVASFVALESFMAEFSRRRTATRVAPPEPTPAASTGSLSVAPAIQPVEEATPPPPPPVERPMFGTFEPPAETISAEPPPTASTMLTDADEKRPVRWRPPVRLRWIAAAAVLVALVGAGAIFGRQYLSVMPAAVAEVPGTLVVTTSPAGIPVLVDGQARGVTPLTLEVAAGSHELTLATDGEPRIIPFNITAGSTVSHTIELPKANPQTGQLTVHTEPPGARVTIDTALVGTTPLTIQGLTPGAHSVALATDLNSVTQNVVIEAGATSSLVVPMAMPQGVPVSGWISVQAPVEVQVYEQDRLLGTSVTDRIMVSAGRHEFSIVNDSLRYRTTRSVTVSPGKVSTIKLDWPNGSIAVNAQPWAEVWIDGVSVGETPIGKVEMPVGIHEVVFRHPQHGQQVIRATVTAGTTTRVSVDMTKR